MKLETGRMIAGEVIDKLGPFCSRIEVVGSIRRARPLVHDIDIVLIPSNQGRLALALRDLGETVKTGPFMHSCRYRGQQVDIYIANQASWATYMLIRTGSKQHNIMLCAHAKAKGMKLHADGSGLEMGNKRIIPTTEKQVFDLLGLKYKEPEERN